MGGQDLLTPPLIPLHESTGSYLEVAMGGMKEAEGEGWICKVERPVFES